MNDPSAQVTFDIKRKPFPARLHLRVRPLSATIKGKRIVLTIAGKDFSLGFLKEGWQTFSVETPKSIWHQGRNYLKLKIEKAGRVKSQKSQGLLRLDYLMLSPP